MQLVSRICAELSVHATLKDWVAQIENVQPDGDMFDAKVQVLSEDVKYHFKEEQNEMFPQARETNLDMVALGAQLASRKEGLMAMRA